MTWSIFAAVSEGEGDPAVRGVIRREDQRHVLLGNAVGSGRVLQHFSHLGDVPSQVCRGLLRGELTRVVRGDLVTLRTAVEDDEFEPSGTDSDSAGACHSVGGGGACGQRAASGAGERVVAGAGGGGEIRFRILSSNSAPRARNRVPSRRAVAAWCRSRISRCRLSYSSSSDSGRGGGVLRVRTPRRARQRIRPEGSGSESVGKPLAQPQGPGGTRRRPERATRRGCPSRLKVSAHLRASMRRQAPARAFDSPHRAP